MAIRTLREWFYLDWRKAEGFRELAVAAHLGCAKDSGLCFLAETPECEGGYVSAVAAAELERRARMEAA
jgi:hypothetical protein